MNASVAVTHARDCRGCGGALEVVLDLGEAPLANSLLSDESVAEAEPRYPLRLARCASCSLLQLTDTVDPAALFGEYVYFSSWSDTMLAHARALAERLIADEQLDADSLVVEVASNDGYLLRNYVARGVPALGVEPAANVARVALERGVPTVVEFFGAAFARRLADERGRADVLHAHNVIAHVPDIHDFLEGVAAALAEGGVAVVEAPVSLDLVDKLEFDTIYHEHVFYFCLSTLLPLVRRHGLDVVDVEHLPLHGGTLRYCIAHEGRRARSARVDERLALERAWGALDGARLAAFSSRVAALCDELRGLLERERAGGHRIAAYGASAKGATLLHAAGIGGDLIDYVVDRSAVKQGRLTPGTKLRIFPPAKLLEDRPDLVLLLSWNFADEILEQQREVRARGSRFVIPVPAPRIV